MMDNIVIAIGIMVIVGAAIFAIYKFCQLSKDKQFEIIFNWLQYAVIIAEKELGSGTGQLKLRYVYDLFIDKFKFLSMFISFEQFSMYVDQALDVMEHMINTNKRIEDYVNKE